jgi:hypothetical protein
VFRVQCANSISCLEFRAVEGAATMDFNDSQTSMAVAFAKARQKANFLYKPNQGLGFRV